MPAKKKTAAPADKVYKFCRYCGNGYQVRADLERCPNCTVEYVHTRHG